MLVQVQSLMLKAQLTSCLSTAKAGDHLSWWRREEPAQCNTSLGFIPLPEKWPARIAAVSGGSWVTRVSALYSRTPEATGARRGLCWGSAGRSVLDVFIPSRIMPDVPASSPPTCLPICRLHRFNAFKAENSSSLLHLLSHLSSLALVTGAGN